MPLTAGERGALSAQGTLHRAVSLHRLVVAMGPAGRVARTDMRIETRAVPRYIACT
jgi:hypothetical protein